MPTVPDNGPYSWEQVPDLSHRETQYLVLQEMPNGDRKTRRWNVLSKSSGVILGRIRWHGAWRQFVFLPEANTLFNLGCLMEINGFLVDALTDWRLTKQRANKSVDASPSG